MGAIEGAGEAMAKWWARLKPGATGGALARRSWPWARVSELALDATPRGGRYLASGAGLLAGEEREVSKLGFFYFPKMAKGGLGIYLT